MDSDAQPPQADGPITRRQRTVLLTMLVATVLLGAAVTWRSAFMQRRMTDLGCYLRGAWAVRAGADVYSVTDTNDWHYNYPPFLAILLGPLAETPPGEQPVTALPYVASVIVWYAFGVLALMLSVHLLASALEQTLTVAPTRFGCQWWATRLAPVVLLAPGIGRTLARGQVNLVVLVLLAGWIAGAMRGRSFSAGFCLALATCIKVIPALLLIHPLWRRDLRALSGAAAGFVFALAALPAAVCGPEAAIAQVERYIDTTIRPGLGLGGDLTRYAELNSPNGTDSQSIMTALHNIAHPHPWYRPWVYERWVRRTHWILGALMMGLTLWCAGRGARSARDELCFAGALLLIMTLISPVSHLHYFVFGLPAVMGLWWEPRARYAKAICITFFVVNAISLLPHYWLRQFGTTTVAAMLVWAVAVFRTKDAGAAIIAPVQRPLSAAA